MVHVKFDPNSVSINDVDLQQQQQIGYGSIDYNYFHGGKPFQRGFGYYQNGSGISDILRHLWRTFMPVLKTTGKAIGKEALHTGSRVLEDIAQGTDVKESLAKEALKGVENVIDKSATFRRRQQGSGISKIRKKQKRKSDIHSLNSFNNYLKNNKSTKKRKRSDAFGFY